VPEKSRASFEGFDDSREMKLDMNYYRALLSAGTSRLAYLRALDCIRPRENGNDGDFYPL
jgi:hypothetical protein